MNCRWVVIFGPLSTDFELYSNELGRYTKSHGMQEKDFQNKQGREVSSTYILVHRLLVWLKPFGKCFHLRLLQYASLNLKFVMKQYMATFLGSASRKI